MRIRPIFPEQVAAFVALTPHPEQALSIQQHRTTYGAEDAAQLMLSILQNMEYDPAWWQLAYTADGVLVGLVMPTKSLTVGTIGYIGVVPGQRGLGYSYDLLVRGTTTLHAAGISVIRADADVDNEPMAKAFRRTGYTQAGTRREYQLKHTVTFADGLQIIVRISRGEAKNVAHFEQELWAIRACGAR